VISFNVTFGAERTVLDLITIALLLWLLFLDLRKRNK
jgi:hypothetical protein